MHNTGGCGSKGLPDHQAKVSDLHKRAEAELLAGERVLKERKIQGFPNSRRIPDVQIVGPDGVARKIFEAERFPNRLRNRLREAEYGDLVVPFETYPHDYRSFS